jgi:hypothetical protein
VLSVDVMCKTKAMENMEAVAMNKSISSGIVRPEEHEGEVADGPNVVAHSTRASARKSSSNYITSERYNRSVAAIGHPR